MLKANIPFIMLDEKSGSPLYRQIYEAIRCAILNGEFQPMLPLPATRFLAKQLGVSRMTVVNAYDQLFAEGYLESKTGSGTFVAAQLPEEFLQPPRAEKADSENQSSSRKINFSTYGESVSQNSDSILQHNGETSFLPFQHGVSAVDKFPFEIWSKITRKWQKNPPKEILAYGNPAGFFALREAVAAHLSSARGVRCTTDQVIITSGTQQALNLISRVLIERNDKVWIEDPCYLGAHDIFTANGAKIIPVPVDDEGFDLQAARKKSPGARLVYVTPSHQYPLGITMSLSRRLNLLEWARETESFIIEDDYNSEYRYAGRPLASLQGLDRDGRVIYLGNFSKTIFPGLRLGCLVVPPDLAETFAAARALDDLHSPLIDQVVLAEFISEGYFARHVRQMRKLYESRQQVLVAEIQKHLSGVIEIAPAESGMHLIGWLPEYVSDQEISNRGAEANLKLTPISKYCINRKMPGGLIFGYTIFSEKQIKQGVKKLSEMKNLWKIDL